jgi:hypothetical protein
MAGTTTSSGLNNMLADTQQVQTTLPSWMDTAQQNVISQAGAAQGAAPAFGQTAAQGAVNTLQPGAANPFTQAQGSLNTIASGAANPWITDPTTGAVTPNTQTAMGGLFAAQNQQLNQLLPYQNAGTEAGAIGSGNFGSLRGQTAVDTSSANAFDTLAAQQMQAALQNQQTGATAAGTLGNVANQGINAGLTTGAAQMNAPYQGALNYANLINSVNAPTTVSQQNQMSPLSMLGSLSQIPTAGTSLLNSIFGAGSGTPGTSGYVPPGLTSTLTNLFPSLFGSGTSTYTPSQTQAAVDATTTANMAPANPNPTAPDPSTITSDE